MNYKERMFTADELASASEALPLFPAVAAEAIAALKNPNYDAGKISRIVSREPVISAELIRLANSGLHSYGQKIRSVQRAVLQLGFDNTRFYIYGICLRPLFSSPFLQQVWNHSIAAAKASRRMGELSNYPSPEDAMLTGLIHDVGQIVLLALGSAYTDRYRALRQQGLYPLEIEQVLTGKTHAEIGSNLLDRWNFPKDLVEAVRFHHSPRRSVLPLTGILYLTESWTCTDEDIFNRIDRQKALELSKLKYDYVLHMGTDDGLDVLQFAARN